MIENKIGALARFGRDVNNLKRDDTKGGIYWANSIELKMLKALEKNNKMDIER